MFKLEKNEAKPQPSEFKSSHEEEVKRAIDQVNQKNLDIIKKAAYNSNKPTQNDRIPNQFIEQQVLIES